MQPSELINKYLAGFLIFVTAAFLLFGLSEFLSSFLGAIIFYILFRKFMAFLVFQKKFKKSFAAIIIIIISFLIVVLPIGILVTMILGKVSSLSANTDLIKDYVNVFSLKLEQYHIHISAQNVVTSITKFVSQHAGDFLSSSLSIAATLLMMYFLLYFLLVNVKKLEMKLNYYLPFEDDKISLFGKELVDQTYGNAIGVPAVATAQGIAAYIAFLIAGIPDAGIYAILTGFASIIPLVGTAVIWIPVAIYLFAINHNWQGIFVIVFCLLVLTNLDNLVRMYVSKKIGDVHPVTTVLGVIFGLKFFGLTGLVFGPLLISYFLLMIKLYHDNYKTKTIEEIEETEENDKNVMMQLLNKIFFFTDNFNKPSSKGEKPS
jgi:predicted PurR-regulated permease PerM